MVLRVGTDNAALGWLDDVERARQGGGGLRRELRARSEIDRVVDLASNDYLGLVRTPRWSTELSTPSGAGVGERPDRAWSPARRPTTNSSNASSPPSWEPSPGWCSQADTPPISVQ